MRNKLFGLLLVTFYFLIGLFVYRDLLIGIGTKLLDWNDYPYYVWVVGHNVRSILSLKFAGFFNTNAFYPLEGTLLFSDLLLPQSLIMIIPRLLGFSWITSFNLMFFVTILLNIIASYYLWKELFTNKYQIFIGVMLTAFSPFFFLSLGHLQMVSYWPFLFGLVFLLKTDKNIKDAFLVGLFAAIQFLASSYLGIFFCFLIGGNYLLDILRALYKRYTLKDIFVKSFVVLATFSLLVGPFLAKYLQVRNAYDIKWDYGEFITYSAHLSDYIFVNYYKSALYGSSLFAKWNSLNMHTVGEAAGFPGIVISLLSCMGLFSLYKNRRRIYLGIATSKNNLLMFLMVIVGFIFSLGPRLNVNGAYLKIPLPYFLIFKLVPFVSSIRANDRWMFLLFIGLVYFSLKGFEKINGKFRHVFVLTALTFLLYVFEMLPLNLKFESKAVGSDVYRYLKESCIEGKNVLLEFPMTQNKDGANVVTNLSYRTRMQLASLEHDCLLVNGYSGFIPQSYWGWESGLWTMLIGRREKDFIEMVEQKGVNFLKFNKGEMYPKDQVLLNGWLKKNFPQGIVYEDDDFLLIKTF